MPSSIYWNGLGQWGIRRFLGAQSEYHRSLDWLYRQRSAALRNDDNEPLIDEREITWDPGLPLSEPGFPYYRDTKACILLTRDQAIYLKERILSACPGSVLAYLVDCGEVIDIDAAHVWEHPSLTGMPASLLDQIDHARRFSELMYGASLLYNAMLAKLLVDKASTWEKPLAPAEAHAATQSQALDYTKLYDAAVDQWSTEQVSARDAIDAWSIPNFWSLVTKTNPHVPTATRRFVESWIEITRRMPLGGSVRDDAHACQLVSDREWFLKRQRARLHNVRQLEIWSGASGLGQLRFRWPAARRILADIQVGLTKGLAGDA